MKSKRKSNRIINLIFIISILLFLILYSKDNFTSKESIQIIYISKSNDMKNGFWRSIADGAKLAASDYNINLTIWAPEDEENYIQQNQLILDAIKEKPNAIVLAAASQENTYEVSKKVIDHNIKLILIDSIVKEDIADATIATDNYQAGIRMGAVMKTFIDADDEVGIMSSVKGTSTAISRESGIRMGLTDDKDKIVECYYSESSYDKALLLTKKMLREHPKIKVIAALNQHAAIGVGRAVKELGLDGQIKIFGFDNATEEIQYLEDGTFKALVIQKPFNMGYIGIETAVKLVKGEKTDTNINTGSALITKDTMYSSLNQKLLFPFMEE